MTKKIIPWEVLSESESRAPGGWMRIVTRKYKLPNGKVSDWDLLNGGQTVAVLALTSENDVILGRQFRPGPGLVLDEMPGGYVDAEESPEEAAARELLEESGYAGDLEIVANTWLASTALTHRYVAIARNCRKVAAQTEDEGEYILPVTKSLQEFIAQVRKGELTDTDLAYLALDHAGLLPK